MFQVPAWAPAPAVSAVAPPEKPSFIPTSVEVDADYQRIAALPRREWDQAPDLERLIQLMTRQLRTPQGGQQLRPVQAAALREIYDVGGLFAAMCVGSGKTLITAIGPTLLRSQRPLLIVPSALYDKTIEDLREYSRHWQVHPELLREATQTNAERKRSRPCILSYEEIQGKHGGLKLIAADPDSVWMDEVHFVKDRSTKRHKKIKRAIAHWRKQRRVPVGVLTGSAAGRAFSEYWQAIRWALGDFAPLPLELRSFLSWSYSLDEKVPDFSRLDPGPLCELSPYAYEVTLELKRKRGEIDPPTRLEVARTAYGLRFVSCPGVISTKGDIPPNGLIIEVKRVLAPAPIRAAIEYLREHWETPDGHEFETALELWARERWLSHGGWYRWDPYPPMEWNIPRKAISGFVREVLSKSKILDSREEVETAIRAGKINDYGMLADWEAIKPSFVANSVWTWLEAGSHVMVEDAVEWLRANPERGIVWVVHKSLGRAVSALAGVPYYEQDGGRDAFGNQIKHARRSCVASIKSCGTGQNLQWFNTNYMLEFPTKGDVFEQLIGRTHRSGQEADDVHVTIPLMTEGDARALEQACSDARRGEGAEQQPNKLCYGTWIGYAYKNRYSNGEPLL